LPSVGLLIPDDKRKLLPVMAAEEPVKTIRLLLLIVISFSLTAAAQDLLKSQQPIWTGNPDVSAFEKMENDHLAKAQTSIDAIVAVKGQRTIENTLAPYDNAVRQINSAAYLAGLMQQVHPESAFRDHASAMLGKASAAQASLSLNRDVYNALASLDTSQGDAGTRYYVQRTLLELRLAGVNKDDATRARLKQLNEQLTNQESMFGRNIDDDKRSVEISDQSELEGLPEDYIAQHKPGTDGRIQITTDYPDFFPAMTYAKNDNLRRKLMIAFLDRAYPKNRAVLKDMMNTRYEIATLLGYQSWADYNAADKMVGSGGNIATFIHELDVVTRPAEQKELAMLLAEKQKTHPGATDVWDYENWYYPELVRRAKYNFDSQSVRPYFPYEEVKQGILDVAARFFHVSFQREKDAPAWDPSVETWDVFDNGKAIGRFYLDMHPRPGKYSHAAMFQVLDGVRGKQLPEAALICNLPAPTATDAGLNDYGDVETFFHEFGHLMNWILGGQQRWAGISGLSPEMDFVEAPSQMLEDLLRSPKVLASFAHHYKTGEPIPAELVERMNRASTFLRAGKVAQQNGFAAISYDMYKSNPAKLEPDAICNADFHNYLFLRMSPGTEHFYSTFGHLAEYSSAYYTYMWDKVIAEDFFSEFNSDDPLAGETSMRYRQLILEPGGSMPASDLVKNFLGRQQNMDAFERWMNAEFATSPQQTAHVQRSVADRQANISTQ
jgi:thimet oligopeptidase